MTTMTLSDTQTVTTARARAADTGRGLSFTGVLRGEWIKLTSLRSIRWSIIVMIVLSWAGSLMMTLAFTGTELVTPETMPTLIAQSATFSSNITVLIMGVLGVLAVTSEYSSGMILSSLSAVPKRTPMLAAKATAVALLALVVGALSIIGSGLIAALVFGESALAVLIEPAVLASMFGTIAYLMLATLLALGIGALLRSGAGAIAVVVVLLFISTLVFQILTMTGWAWVPQVAEWLPADLGYELSSSPLMPADAPAEMLGVGYWPALGGLVAWAVAALVPAAILLKTRDAV